MDVCFFRSVSCFSGLFFPDVNFSISSKEVAIDTRRCLVSGAAAILGRSEITQQKKTAEFQDDRRGNQQSLQTKNKTKHHSRTASMSDRSEITPRNKYRGFSGQPLENQTKTKLAKTNQNAQHSCHVGQVGNHATLKNTMQLSGNRQDNIRFPTRAKFQGLGKYETISVFMTQNVFGNNSRQKTCRL